MTYPFRTLRKYGSIRAGFDISPYTIPTVDSTVTLLPSPNSFWGLVLPYNNPFSNNVSGNYILEGASAACFTPLGVFSYHAPASYANANIAGSQFAQFGVGENAFYTGGANTGTAPYSYFFSSVYVPSLFFENITTTPILGRSYIHQNNELWQGNDQFQVIFDYNTLTYQPICLFNDCYNVAPYWFALDPTADIGSNTPIEITAWTGGNLLAGRTEQCYLLGGSMSQQQCYSLYGNTCIDPFNGNALLSAGPNTGPGSGYLVAYNVLMPVSWFSGSLGTAPPPSYTSIQLQDDADNAILNNAEYRNISMVPGGGWLVACSYPSSGGAYAGTCFTGTCFFIFRDFSGYIRFDIVPVTSAAADLFVIGNVGLQWPAAYGVDVVGAFWQQAYNASEEATDQVGSTLDLWREFTWNEFPAINKNALGCMVDSRQKFIWE